MTEVNFCGLKNINTDKKDKEAKKTKTKRNDVKTPQMKELPRFASECATNYGKAFINSNGIVSFPEPVRDCELGPKYIVDPADLKVLPNGIITCGYIPADLPDLPLPPIEDMPEPDMLDMADIPDLPAD